MGMCISAEREDLDTQTPTQVQSAQPSIPNKPTSGQKYVKKSAQEQRSERRLMSLCQKSSDQQLPIEPMPQPLQLRGSPRVRDPRFPPPSPITSQMYLSDGQEFKVMRKDFDSRTKRL